MGRVHRASPSAMRGVMALALKVRAEYLLLKPGSAVLANFCLFCRTGFELPGDPLEVIQLQRCQKAGA